MLEAIQHVVSFLRPRGTLPPERVAEIEDVQKRSATLTKHLEEFEANHDDPFEDFARRARESRWRA